MTPIAWVTISIAFVYLIVREVVSYLANPPAPKKIVQDQLDYLKEVQKATEEIENAKIDYRNSDPK